MGFHTLKLSFRITLSAQVDCFAQDYLLYKRKVQRKYIPRVPKRMTLVAGFICRDGLLICADMEEVSGISSRRVSKLFFREAQGAWNFVVTGAGSAAVMDNAIKKLWPAAKSKVPKYDETNMEDALSGVLKTVYKKYVWPDTRADHSISLILGYSDARGLQQSLWVTHDLVPMPIARHVCAGIGEDLANYLADQLWHPFFSEQQAVRVAAFIFKEVKDHVGGVGQGTEMWMLGKAGSKNFYDRTHVEVLEKSLPSFGRTIYEYGKDITGPLFPQLPFTLAIPHKEVCNADRDSIFEGPSVRGAKSLGKLSFK
jgi:20S proteasome alpha/beta subunit